MLVLSLHNPHTCGGSKCLRLPTKHSAITAPNHLEATFQSREDGREKLECVCVYVCVCVQRNDWERHENPQITKKEENQGGCNVSARVCSFKVINQLKITAKTYICQSWETSDVKCQRARWNTDKFPSYFSPFIFKQMLWILILLYKICRKRQKKNHLFFLPTKLSEKELCVNLEILFFFFFCCTKGWEQKI